MHREAPIGSNSLVAAGLTVLVAQVFHPTLLGVLWVGATAGWLAVLLGGLFAFLLFWPVAARLATIPGGSLIGLARAAGGAFAAVLTALLIAGLLVWHSGLVLREASEMAVTAVYPHTPQTFAMVTLVAAALYGAFGGMDAIVFLCRAFLPVLLLVIFAILVGGSGWGEARYLLPLWGPGPAQLVLGSVLVAALYAPMLFLLVGARSLRDRQRLWRVGLMVAGGGALSYLLVKVVLLITFPYPLGRIIPFPLHALARLVLGGRFLERIESLWLFFWVYATGCHLAALLHTASALYAEAVGFPSHRTAVLPMVLTASTLALLPPDIGRAITWHIGSAPVALAVAFGLPLLLALLAAGRRRWKRGR